jgi:hypothetical protein
MRIKTVRDLIRSAADQAGVSNYDSEMSGSENKSYQNALTNILMKKRLKGMISANMEQFKVAWVANPNGNYMEFHEYKDLSNVTADEQIRIDEGLPIQRDSFIYVKQMIMKPDSISMGLPGSSTVVNISEVDRSTMFQSIGTLYGDVSYPRFWSWVNGKNPKIYVNGAEIQPTSLVINACYDEFSDVGLDDDVTNWNVGLPELCAVELAYKITCMNGMPDDRLMIEMTRMKNEYEAQYKINYSYSTDPSAPGVNNHRGFSFIAKPYR